MKLIYLGKSSEYFTYGKIYDSIDEYITECVVANDGRQWVCDIKNFMTLSEFREQRINKILE